MPAPWRVVAAVGTIVFMTSLPWPLIRREPVAALVASLGPDTVGIVDLVDLAEEIRLRVLLHVEAVRSLQLRRGDRLDEIGVTKITSSVCWRL